VLDHLLALARHAGREQMVAMARHT
jgi:hypothetical protein